MLKRTAKLLLVVFLVVVLFLALFLLALRSPAVQTFVAQKATSFLSEKLKAKISIEKVRIVFFDEIDLLNFYIEDLDGDTLIYAKRLNVDFGAFELMKKVIDVNQIVLTDAKVHLKRDSLGTNISKLFSALASGPAKADTTKSKSTFSWKPSLDNVRLINTDVKYLDLKSDVEVIVGVPDLRIDVKNLALDQKIVRLNSVIIDGADVTVNRLKRLPKVDTDSSRDVHFLKGLLQVEWDEFALTNARFRMNDWNVDTVKAKGMDFKRLDVTDINLFIAKGSIIEDTIFGRIDSLRANERCGLKLRRLSADARVSVHDITLTNLLLKTANSEVHDYLSLQYDHFREFKKFLQGVRIKADLNKTKFCLKDLGYFVPNLEKLQHNTFIVSGRFKGAVSNIDGRNIEIRTGLNTVFRGDVSTRGLPDIFETSLNLRVKQLTTTAADVHMLYPSAKLPQNLSTLGKVNYTGTVDGFLTDFVSNGNLTTQIGNATTDVNFTYDKAKNKSAYRGNLALQDFDLGKYFGDEKTLGKVSLYTKINGGGLTLESLHAELNGQVSSLTLLGHNYRAIDLDGFVVKKSFNGSFYLNDPNLELSFNGRVDLSKEIPEFKFDADVVRANFKELNLLKNDFRFSGQIRSDFAGVSVDDIIGRIDINNVVLWRDTIDAYLNYTSIDVKTLTGGKKLFEFKTDFAEGEVDGNFNYKDLPKAFISLAKSTFTKDFVETEDVANQDFHFDFRLFNPGKFTRIIHPSFTSIRNSYIEGSFSNGDQVMNLVGHIPEIQFGNIRAKNFDIDASSEKDYFDLALDIGKVYNNDSLWIDTFRITSQTSAEKDIKFNLMVGDKKRYNYANITANITPLLDQTLIKLEPSDVKLANYNWRFDQGNHILIRGKQITTQGLVFRSAEQSVYIDSYLKNDTSTSVRLTLDNTSISDFTGIFTTKMRDLVGSVNGKLTVEDVFYKPQVFADFVVDEFYLGKELIGDINIESRLDESGKGISVYASVKSINNFLEAKGKISIDPLNPGISIDVVAPKVGLNFLNYKFFERYVKDVRGNAAINARVYGTLQKPLLGGTVTLINDTVTVSFTNTRYSINNQIVKLDERGFDFGTLAASDIRNKPLTASGRINHQSFKQFELACAVDADDVQFLNTNEAISPYFHGVVFGKGNVAFNGPISSPVITAYAMTRPGSYCRLPIRNSYETNKYSFYKFSDGKEGTAPTTKEQIKLNGVTFILDLDVTPDARMDIILDPVTGDLLTGYGRGNLKIEIPKVGNISMYGTYEIERGSYLFTLQKVINKRFEITRGGTINFTGDIYKAGLNVDAVYEVRTSMTDLISDLISESGGTPQSQLAAAARARVPTRLALKLTGILERPNIAFDIRAIDPDPAIRSYVEQKLAILKTNDNEMNKQVFGLLVMNRFLPQSPFGSAVANTSFGGTATNTVSEFVSTQLTNYLSSLLGYANVKNLDINIDYRQYEQAAASASGSSTLTNDVRRELQLELSQRFLNNRLSINAGGNLDFGSSQVVQGGTRSVIPTGDFQIEYALTKDGVWRAKAFNRTNYDYFNSRNNNRTGLGLSFRKEFDKPSELFVVKKKEKKGKKRNQP